MQTPMTIAVFGGSGRTGKAFVAQALAAGLHVRALARNPAAMPQHPQLEVLQGSVTDAAAVLRTCQGAQVVVSLIGHAKGSPKDVQQQATRHYLVAMQQLGIGRIVSLTGGAVPYPAQDQPKGIDKVFGTVMRLVAPKMVADAVAHAQLLANSAVQWCVVRAPRLTNKPAKGTYRVGWVGVNSGTEISRADLAAFLLQEATQPAHTGHLPFVSW